MEFIYEEERHRRFFDRDADLGGSNPRRTKCTHPYNYDPFTVWGGQDSRVKDSVYSDRIFEWDSKKAREIGKEVFGEGRWYGQGCDGEKIQEFLRRFFDMPKIVLTRVVEYCDVSNGYPCWRLDFFNQE